ncbi:zinc ribbon domain-containing protein [Paracraurococcus lichenis]|uniref:Zinc ribbon domain-containing protein n=1 Tax=Paracraurococcus lichenis TaxID=3064888 RepID=A0ABT9E170_9PROT|nr:zinc ribbon domain-containing protein [Paracraurococcus sp. LOR1-02]MDO9709903.1 zinc ribbon domain-containing protein [Paracraurococcus sp. LOR1-02]
MMSDRQRRSGTVAQGTTTPEQRACPACGAPLPEGAAVCGCCESSSHAVVPLAAPKDATLDRDVAPPVAADLPQRQSLVLLVCDLSEQTGDAMEFLEACTQAARMFGGWPAFASGTEVAFRFDPTAASGMQQFAATDRLDRAFDAGLNVVLDVGRRFAGLRIVLHEGDTLFVKGSTIAAVEAELLGPMRTDVVMEGPVRQDAHAMCLAAPPLGMVVSAAAAKGLAPARRMLLRRLPADHSAARVGGAYLWQPILAAAR